MDMSTASTPPVRTWSAALLLHIAEWVASQDHWVVSPHITLGRFEGSRFERIYLDLVRTRGLDDGEPIQHCSYALIVPQERGHECGHHNPDSPVEAVANLIALVARQALSWSRQILSWDDFRVDLRTHELHETYGQQEFLQKGALVFTDDELDRLTRAWAGVEAMRRRKDHLRLARALGYFGQSWRVPGLDETGLYLGAALEALFAPPGTVGTPGQIIPAVVRAAGGSADKRARLGRLVHQFYEVRADLVEVPCHEAAIDTTIAMFEEVALLLERILTRLELLAVFTSEPARVQWLGAGPAH